LKHPYASEAYAKAFYGLAEPVACLAWDNFVLKRPIPGTDLFDALGSYPLAVLPGDPTTLSAGIEALRAQGLVSVVLVADALCAPTRKVLEGVFDLVRPFKTHYLHDYTSTFAYGRHHRYEVRRSRAVCEVRGVDYAANKDVWEKLYSELVARHSVSGVQRFSAHYFDALGQVPGLHALAAFFDDRIVAMHLFFEHDGIAYSHLAASDVDGYRVRGAYALNAFAIEYFRGLKLLDFGAGAGTSDDPSDGLAKFKRGFANRTEIFYLCGKVLDPKSYQALSQGKEDAAYFPAYRG
jgi:hypothetical protein